eukprot:TRINITY_DN5378_c0_g1_i1.p1 TRINITY_DN5378_c0_g1~~TRINITY_DN5378_c0_g1_i1.p1  ORF type:complete len:622 (+),score=127.21 TRINITY_DN5378_c0_g1_i1:58-1923(+)
MVSDNKGGEPREPNPDFAGPTEKRSCRDVLMLLLFIGYWVGMFIVAGYAVENGDPKLLLYPKDSKNNICGVDNRDRFVGGLDMSDMKYLYWPSVTDLSIQLCVKSCPTQNSVVGGLCDSSSTALCEYVEDVRLQPTSYGGKGECCPYETDDYFYRCLPLNQTLEATYNILGSVSGNLDASDTASDIVSDVAKVYYWIVLCGVLAVILGFVWLLVIRISGGAIVWISAILMLFALGGLTAQIWRFADETDDDNESDYTPDYDALSDSAEAARIVSYVFLAITIAFFFMLIFLRKRITIAIEICKEAGRVIASMPSVIFYPIFPFLVLLVVIIYWIYILLFLVTVEETAEAPDEVPEKLDDIRYLAIYHTIGFIWTMNTISAISQCTLAGAVATYYFSRDKSNVPSFPIIRAFYRTMRYHFGSMAFGALVLTIVQVIRLILNYMKAQLKAQEQNGSPTKVAQMIVCCLDCCCKCVEEIVEYIDRNAYILIAIHGDSFCSASVDAFKLIWRNAMQLTVLNFVGDFLIFLGKVLIAALCGIISVGIFRYIEEDLSCWIIPVMIVVLISFGIASIFLSIYEMTIDTLILCFCEDRELNAKSGQYFMSDTLRNAIGEGIQKVDENRA